MAYDLVIKNGLVVDGSGFPRYRADVGIKDGKIVAKGRIDPNGAKVVDAEGRIVAPGFVDVHTHYDAQIFWDPLLTCSPWHGATTVVMGNCGFTLAPCRPEHRDYLLRMFARVEGINLKALETGLEWEWQTFPEYLNRIKKEKLGVNVGTMIGHCAVRRYIMGEAANEREADDDEIQQMKSVVREGIAAGAFGFTTTLSPTHYGMDGRPVPSRFASHKEVLELASALAEFHIGSIEIITETAVMGEDKFSEADQRLLTNLSLVTGRPINWNELSHTWDRPTAWRQQIEYMERASKEGAQVYGIARCQRLDAMFNLTESTMSFERWPRWHEVLSQPREKTLALLRDPEVRAAMKAEANELDSKNQVWRQLTNVNLVKSKTGKFAEFEGANLKEIGERTGKDLVDVLLDFSVEENLETEFAFIGVRNGDMNAVAEILTSPFALPGISDAGAHTNRLSGSYYSTFLLSHWVRDEGLLTLEDAIKRLTFMPASMYGMWDKGLIREGMAADIVVFDLDKLDWLPAERFNDLPGGDARLVDM
ncbi:MAG: amidohydrolase family protein [Chloroflexi bacterium]|nr:amidohydrolase family protein [Chloroflexota bacterium]